MPIKEMQQLISEVFQKAWGTTNVKKIVCQGQWNNNKSEEGNQQFSFKIIIEKYDLS